MLKMKTLLITILLLLPLSFANAVVDFSTLKISLSDNMQRDCTVSNTDILGCYFPATDQIFIDQNLSLITLRVVLLHEVGHFLMKDVVLEEYQRVFSNWDCQTLPCLQETAATYFTLWMDKIPMQESYQQFFTSLFK